MPSDDDSNQNLTMDDWMPSCWYFRKLFRSTMMKGDNLDVCKFDKASAGNAFLLNFTVQHICGRVQSWLVGFYLWLSFSDMGKKNILISPLLCTKGTTVAAKWDTWNIDLSRNVIMLGLTTSAFHQHSLAIQWQFALTLSIHRLPPNCQHLLSCCLGHCFAPNNSHPRRWI